MFGSDESIKLVLSYGKFLGTILGNVDVITLGIDVGTDLGSLDGPIDCCNYVNIEVLFLGESLVFNSCKVLASDEGIKLGFSDG